MMNTVKVKGNTVKFIAHRGLSGLEKENTCAAFVAAGNREAYFGIETDVHVTADGEFVVIHDSDTARVGHDSMIVEKTSSQTLFSLQLCDTDEKRGRRDLQIPSLKDYITICKKYGKECVLEYKTPFCEEDICRSLELMKSLDYLEHMTFISFHYENLVILRRLCPNHTIQYLLDSWEEKNLEDLKVNRLDLDIHYTLLTEKIVHAVHAIGQKVNCWTVNSAEDANRLIDMGVDYITTNILEPTK